MPPSIDDATPPPAPPSAPTRELVLAQLDAEIAAYRAEEQTGGWSPWAVGGALLAVAALLAGAWEKGGADPTRVVFWCLAWSLAADALVTWLVPAAQPVVRALNEARGTVRAWPGTFYRPRRPVYAAACLRYLLLAAACFATGPTLDRVEPGLIFLFPALTYLFRAAQLAVWFKDAGSDAPIPDWTGRREGLAFFGSLQHRSYVPALMSTGQAAAGVWAYVHGAGGWPRPGTPLTADVRIGAFVAAAALLALWLIDLTHRPPVAPRLLEVRRHLVLGRVDAAVAARELEKITEGVELDPDVELAAFEASVVPVGRDNGGPAPTPPGINPASPHEVAPQSVTPPSAAPGA